MRKRGMVSTSSEAIGSIDDLLTLILLCLPVKSLMRFKLVSKKWKSLITSPCFYLKYDVGPNPAVGMFYHDDVSSAIGYIHYDVQNSRMAPFRELKFGEDPSPFWIHHSCNGLLLCCSTENLDYDCNRKRSPISIFYVYNPTTNCFRKLLRPGVVNGVPRIVHGINLAFDPANSPSGKVVCVRESEFAPDILQIEIYYPESDEWRVSGDPFRSKASFDDGVYWNGAIHWINHYDNEVLFFSVDQERFGKIPLPVESNGRVLRNFYYFGESCDHLHLILGRDTDGRITVYEMKRNQSDWFVKYRVNLRATVAPAFFEMGYYDPVVFSLIRGKNESPFLVVRIHYKVIRFNLDCNTFEEVHEVDDDVYPTYKPYEYIESLRMF